jgi:hypothetical protein
MRPEERPAAEKAKKEWAEHHGLKEVRNTPYCVCRLLGKVCKRFGVSDCLNAPPGCDHPSLWLRNGKPVTFVFQPYGLCNADVEKLGAFCRERKLELEVSTWPAWHYPGSVLHVEISKSGEREERWKRAHPDLAARK